MGVPYTFGTATTSIPLSQLDANFNTPVTLGNTTVGLGNTATTIGNLTLTNVTITSGTINAAVVDSGYVANSVVYADSTGVLTSGSANLVFTGTNVGIGTSSPSVPLAVYKASDSAINIQNSTSGVTNVDGLQLLLSGANGYMWNYENGANIFGTNNTERMRIDSSGNVGIGTTSPTAPLTVYAAQYNTMRIGRSDAASFAVGIPNGSATDALQFYGFQAGYDGYLFTGASGDKLYLNTNGNVVLKGGTAAASGVGITFPATQVASSDANCLDDYEEGTFTPAYSGTGGNPTVTYTYQVGRYTKIGNRVYFQLSIDHSAKSGGSGTLTINLPFQVSAVTNNYPTFTVGYSGAVTPASKTGYTDPSRSDFFLQDYNLSTGNMTVSQLNSNGTLMASGQYEVA